jgi:hypothetical protein
MVGVGLRRFMGEETLRATSRKPRDVGHHHPPTSAYDFKVGGMGGEIRGKTKIAVYKKYRRRLTVGRLPDAAQLP